MKIGGPKDSKKIKIGEDFKTERRSRPSGATAIAVRFLRAPAKRPSMQTGIRYPLTSEAIPVHRSEEMPCMTTTATAGNELSGKVALVTGAAQNIGRAINRSAHRSA